MLYIILKIVITSIVGVFTYIGLHFYADIKRKDLFEYGYFAGILVMTVINIIFDLC